MRGGTTERSDNTVLVILDALAVPIGEPDHFAMADNLPTSTRSKQSTRLIEHAETGTRYDRSTITVIRYQQTDESNGWLIPSLYPVYKDLHDR